MSRRSDSLRFKTMPNGDIRAYQSDTYDKRGVSEWMLTNPKNPSPTVITGNEIKIFTKKETDMKRGRDFHRQCRVIYRAMCRQYGIERVQDECLRVFKVVFPFLHRARKGEDYQFDRKAQVRIGEIFTSWNPKPLSELDRLLGHIQTLMERPMKRQDFICFCEDILVVVMRIRKLTPRECGRLMGVSDKDIDTMLNSGISKSAAYKCYGNSIVAGGNFCDKDGHWDGPLFNIFRKLFIDTEQDIVKGEATQLSLF